MWTVEDYACNEILKFLEGRTGRYVFSLLKYFKHRILHVPRDPRRLEQPHGHAQSQSSEAVRVLAAAYGNGVLMALLWKMLVVGSIDFVPTRDNP